MRRNLYGGPLRRPESGVQCISQLFPPNWRMLLVFHAVSGPRATTARCGATARASMNTLDMLKELAAKQFGGEPGSIDVNASVETLGLDSLGFLEFLFEVEDHFGISIPQERVTALRTLAELGAAIDELIAAKHAAPA
jgi:acyl carrier protein